MRLRGPARVVALVAAVALALAACTGSGDDDAEGPAGTGSSNVSGATGPARRGGTVVVGAEEEPLCADWFGACASSRWGLYTMQEHTMPRVFDFAKRSDGTWVEVPNVLLTGEPTLTAPTPEGGRQTVTYNINPDAVWSDGQPITATDFKFTWNEIVRGAGIYDPTGYNLIENVDDTNPQAAVVTFARPYAGWKSLFGAFYGVLPSHLLTGQDRATAMTNGYDWSGGPWIADWTKGVQVELTPNPNWYGRTPRLDRVIFRFQESTAEEFAALRRGEVLAIYPEAQPDAVSATRRGLGNVNTVYTADTGNIEAIWINNEKPPFNGKAVRQALAFAVGRDAIVRRLFAPLGVTRAVNSINPPIQYAYSDPEAWSRYRRDLGEVTRLMQGDGWAKNAAGVWEKGGQAAAITITTTTGNPRRQLITRMLREQLDAAGFALTVDTVPSSELFDTILPAGNYQLALYTQIATSLQPALCTIFCSANIPSAANDFRGQNYGRVSTAADDPLTQVTTNLDVAAGQAAGKQADQILAEEQVALPLDPLPNLLLWSNRIVGPVRDDPILGMFANIDQWGLARRTDS